MSLIARDSSEIEDRNWDLERLVPIRSTDTNELIQERLMQYIRQQGLLAGAKLPAQSKLARGLGVSLVSLREALRSLEALGIVEGRVGSGWFIKTFSFDPIAKGLLSSILLNKHVLADLNDIRVHLESSFFEHAAKTLTHEDLDELDRLIGEMVERSQSGHSWDDLDRLFHMKLFSEIRNRVFSQLMDVFWSMYGYLGAEIEPTEKVSEAQTHQPIVDALREGNVEEAKRRLMESLEGSARRMPPSKGSRDLADGTNLAEG
jgi:DNA-binding FadR family transcriptional regulator